MMLAHGCHPKALIVYCPSLDDKICAVVTLIKGTWQEREYCSAAERLEKTRDTKIKGIK